MRHRVILAALFLVSSTLVPSAHAAWPNHAINLPVSVGPGTQALPTAASDGSGGAFIFWSQGSAIHGQKVSADGSLGWDTTVVVCAACPGGVPTAVADASGGVYIATGQHNDASLYQTYVHRVAADGSVILSVTQPGGGLDPDITAEGTGGAIVVWENYQSYSGSGVNIFAQRFGDTGTLWRVNVTGESMFPTHELEPAVASDGLGGAIVGWQYGSSIKVQKLDASGSKLWAADGVVVGTGSSVQVVYDGLGGARVALYENGTTWIRRVNSSGVLIGFPIELIPAMGGRIVPTPDGGMIFIGRAAGPLYGRVVVQRMQPDGEMIWGPDGVELFVPESPDWTYHAVPDGFGGVVVTYSNGDPGTFNLFAQHISSDGEKLWGDDGAIVSSAGGDQRYPALTWTSGADYAIATWWDQRSDGGDIYAQRVDGTPNASVERGAGVVTGLRLSPNPFTRNVDIRFSTEHAGVVRGDLFDVRGRLIANTKWNVPSGTSVLRWDVGGAARMEPGVYFVRFTGNKWHRSLRIAHVR